MGEELPLVQEEIQSLEAGCTVPQLMLLHEMTVQTLEVLEGLRLLRSGFSSLVDAVETAEAAEYGEVFLELGSREVGLDLLVVHQLPVPKFQTPVFLECVRILHALPLQGFHEIPLIRDDRDIPVDFAQRTDRRPQGFLPLVRESLLVSGRGTFLRDVQTHQTAPADRCRGRVNEQQRVGPGIRRLSQGTGKRERLD